MGAALQLANQQKRGGENKTIRIIDLISGNNFDYEHNINTIVLYII
jgi:hypothetical protein